MDADSDMEDWTARLWSHHDEVGISKSHVRDYRARGKRSIFRDWAVSDFKILRRGEIVFHPLTILTGANSSGKSSILQSLLLACQSSSGSVVLNGPLVRLGDATDVVRGGAAFSTLRWTSVTVGKEGKQERRRRFDYEVDLAASDGSLEPVCLRLNVDGMPILETHRAGPGETVLSAQTEEEFRYNRLKKGVPLRVKSLLGEPVRGQMTLMMEGLFPVSALLEEERYQIYQRHLDHFGGDAIAKEPRKAQQLLEELYEYWAEGWLDDKDEMLFGHVFEAAGSPTFTAVEGPAAIRELVGTEDLLWLIRLVSYRGNRVPNKRLFIEGDAPNEYYGWPIAETSYADLGEVASFLRGVYGSFQQGVNQVLYLGPLRTGPTVRPTLVGSVPNAPVGVKGELAGAVFESLSEKEQAAVRHWARKLGFGESVGVQRLGKLGYTMTVTDGGSERVLADVGVGVSQVLPILVLTFAAPPESLVVIEQPELHLHPSAQSVLADFFLTARDDVNFVIETHSEYLLTRLRRRIAEGENLPSQVGVYFAQGDRSGTELVELNMANSGTFDQWPQGFFDTQDEEILSLARTLRQRWAEEDRKMGSDDE